MTKYMSWELVSPYSEVIIRSHNGTPFGPSGKRGAERRVIRRLRNVIIYDTSPYTAFPPDTEAAMHKPYPIHSLAEEIYNQNTGVGPGTTVSLYWSTSDEGEPMLQYELDAHAMWEKACAEAQKFIIEQGQGATSGER